MTRVLTWAAGLALAVLALGVAVLPLESPAWTRSLSQRYSLAEEAGLPPARMTAVAEEVRAFVVGGDTEAGLPRTVDGRPGFDASAESHLADVAKVLGRARLATAALAVLLAAFFFGTRRDPRTQAEALTTGAVLTVAIPLVAGVVGLVSFDTLFTAFHSLLFSAGTWTFPYDSLLIRLFPEPFWVACGIAWAVLIALLAGLFGGLGAVLRRVSTDTSTGASS